MDTKRLLALFWLSALACGRRLNDEYNKQNSTNRNLPTTSIESPDDLSSRSYGLKESEQDSPDEFITEVSDTWMPTDSSKSKSKQLQDPDIVDYGEPENPEQLNEPEEMDSFERLNEPEKNKDAKDDNEDFEQVKKVKEVSIISLKPKERNKSLDPISDQQGRPPMRIIRPMRDLSIIVRNRHHPIVIARQVPVHWIPRKHPHKPPYPHKPLLPHKPPHPHKPSHPHHPLHPHKPLYPHNPHQPSMPKHKPCKPCDPKVHKKHKPKKPKKKHKKEHCHHPNPKKPHHKRLLYYAPIPTNSMNYYYGPQMPLITPNNNYEVAESLENEDVEIETEKPFHQEVEDDVEEHRLAEMSEPFDEEGPDETKIKSFEKI
ncbi:sporozoite surface protein 2-like [Aphis gossypii]|uniref:sporozoite surface protein 2-like n=1 Tax=Aphis gossypii TaxID=80765 RepID=UPI0021597848|nr:sporozoite surface protein 2-like [Aphis gossypii]